VADANSTTPPSLPSSPRADGPEWALVCASRLNAGLDEVRSALGPASTPEVRDTLGGVLVEVAKLTGVLEWLGEGLLVLPEGGAA
jgi:hypothetical protein